MSQTTTSFNSAAASWEEHREAFFQALQNSDIPTLQTVLTKYPEAVEWQNKRGERCLHLTFEKRDRETFLFLLKNGADPNQESCVHDLFNRFFAVLAGASTLPTKYILQEAVIKGEKPFIIPLLQYGASEHYANGHDAPKNIRYEICDLLARAPKIRKEFQEEQKAAKATQKPPSSPAPAATNNSEIEVLKPVKVRKNTAAPTRTSGA